MKFFLVILITPIISLKSWGQKFDICDTIFRSSNYGCQNLASSNTMGGSYAMLYDAFNTNPASIPITKTPFGVEYTSTKGKSNFALIKGQNNWGAGISAKDSNSTFFGPYENYKVAMKEQYAESDREYLPRSLDPNFNLATAMNLLKITQIAAPFGLGYKYNPEKKVWSPTLGLGIKTSYLNLGFSAYREAPKESSDDAFRKNEKNDVITMTVGLKVRNFLFDYSKFSQMSRTEYVPIDSQLGLTSSMSKYTIGTEIYSGTFVLGGLNLSYAVRRQDDSRARDTSEASVIDSFGSSYKTKHELFGATYRFAEIFSLGYYYNYELDGGNTLVAQLFIPVKF